LQNLQYFKQTSQRKFNIYFTLVYTLVFHLKI